MKLFPIPVFICVLCVPVQARPLSYNILVPYYQSQSPIQIVSVATSTTYFFNGALLLNAEDSPLIEVQLGWYCTGIRGDGSAFTERRILDRVGIRIGPGQLVSIPNSYPRTSELLEWMMTENVDHLNAQVGVVSARFEDGTAYRFPFAERTEFDVDPADTKALKAWAGANERALEEFLKEVEQRATLNHSVASLRSFQRSGEAKPMLVENLVGGEILPLQGGSSFCCKSTSSMVYCSVGGGGTSCTVSFCPGSCSQYYSCAQNPGCCACQVCSIAPDCN